MNIFPEKNYQFASRPYILLVFVLVLISCNRQQNKEILINHISSADFEDILTVEGVVGSEKSVTLKCPGDVEGEIVYVIEDGTRVNEGDVVCILENRELQNEYEELLLELENTKANMNKSKANLDMQYAILDAQVRNNAVQTAIANLDSLQLKYASPVQRQIKAMELQKAAIVKQKLERKLKALDIINKSQLRRMELQIQRRENRILSTKERLEMLTIKAPQSGMAVRANSWFTGNKVQEGDQVWSNMPLVIIPDLSKMKVTISASEISYKRIDIGDSIEYRFDAMPGNLAWGVITKKAPMGQPVQKGSKVKVFEVEASLERSLKVPDLGMTVTCDVILQRVRDTIVVPQLAIFDEDSIKVVYVKKSDGFERRQVKLGITSPKNAIIASGLSGKETLTLIKPLSSYIKKTILLPKVVSKKKPMVAKQEKSKSKTLKTK